MLDSAGDAQSNVDLGMDGLAGLAHLMVGGDPASVHAGAGGTNHAAQNLSQLLGQLDALLHVLGDTTANGHDEVGADQVDQLLGGLDGIHHLGVDVSSGQLELGLDDLHVLGALALLHHAGANGRHGGTEAGADDGRHQVTAEGRTGHLQVAGHIVILTGDLHGAQLLDALLGQRGGFLQEALVVGHIDVQMGAVRAQTAGGAAGSQVTADVGGAEQQHLGLQLLNGLHDHLGIGIRGEVLQQGGIIHIDLVCAILAQLSRDALDVVAQQNAAQLHAQLVGQLPALGDQFEGGGHHHALTLLAENPYVFEGLNVRTIKRHIFKFPSFRFDKHFSTFRFGKLQSRFFAAACTWRKIPLGKRSVRAQRVRAVCRNAHKNACIFVKYF